MKKKKLRESRSDVMNRANYFTIEIDDVEISKNKIEETKPKKKKSVKK